MRQQRDLRLRQPRQGRVPRPRDQRDRGRPAQREPHLRRLGAGRPRPLARDRQRRHDRGSSRARTRPGLYESFDGGKTFTEVWNGNSPSSLRRHRRRPRPAQPWTPSTRRRSTRASGGVTRARPRRRSTQVFAPQFAGRRDRPDDVRADRQERAHAHLPDRRHGERRWRQPANASNFWRTDNANQPAATLLASQAPARPPPAGNGNPFPATYNGWQRLTLDDDVEPVLRHERLLHRPVLVRPGRLHARGHARHRLRDRARYQYGELPCNTKGVGCGNGRSNGRAVLYSTTAGDPDPASNNRTFTDLTYDAQNTPAPWCAFAPYFAAGLSARAERDPSRPARDRRSTRATRPRSSRARTAA